MGNLLYIIAVILIILWVVGFLFQGFGTAVAGNGLVHALLVIAVIIILLKVIRRA